LKKIFLYGDIMFKILDEKLDSLRKTGISEEVCLKIENHIKNDTSARMLFISPYRLADEWSVSRSETLNAFLYATRLGIFDLEWDLKCPSCKGASILADTLQKLVSGSHCEYCEVDIAGNFDETVEVTFRVNPNIRTLEEVSIFEKRKTWNQLEEHVNLSIDANEIQEIRLNLVPGTYHMIQPESDISCPLKITGNHGESEQVIDYFYDGKNLTKKMDWYGSGSFTLRVTNKSDHNLDFIFARAVEYPWVSGAKVASNQIFRDYFSSELISADESFSVQNMVFVFTDIKGSTDLYERRGDAKAYYLVREHFKIMKDIVSRHDGAIVKTIGDAIMATFLVSSDAISAVFEMQNAFQEFNEREKSLDDIIIKVGVHRGSCIAVTSNDKLDYFGRTVNIAARVQGLSGGHDIMISKTLYQEAGLQDLIDHQIWNSVPIQATLKGIQGLYDVVHLVPQK
jgi:adenylate cyclase